ncbi:MAG TPA: YciI family protein [Gemmatimonadaceae bacterium]|nr:YciI family protein [Gemmatimonadaceae bacterium]
MKYMLLIYNDEKVIGSLQAEGKFDSLMRDCFDHVDVLARQGKFLDAQQLDLASTAKSVRVRGGKVTALDGPFAETKEVLGGFNIIEADSMEEAIEIASHFPWAQTGTVEVRPIRDINTVRENVHTGQAAWAKQGA